MDNAIITIRLDFNAIMFKEDIRYEIKEWLKELRFNHLENKKIISIEEEKYKPLKPKEKIKAKNKK